MVAQNRDGFVRLANSGLHNCFGCSPSNPQGMYMEFYADAKKESVVSWYAVPAHLCGWGDVVHGGIVATMLDEAMGWACITILQKFLLSKSLNVTYSKPVLTGRDIRVEGRVLGVRNEREATMQGRIYNDAGELCAESSSAVSLFPLEVVKKMGIVDDEMIRFFEAEWNLPPSA